MTTRFGRAAGRSVISTAAAFAGAAADFLLTPEGVFCAVFARGEVLVLVRVVLAEPGAVFLRGVTMCRPPRTGLGIQINAASQHNPRWNNRTPSR